VTLQTLVTFAFVWTLGAQPVGWQLIKDQASGCQLAVPPSWNLNPQVPRMATGPDLAAATIIGYAGKSVHPLNEAEQGIVGVDKMLENTQQRVFWAGKPVSLPAGTPPVVAYHVTVAGKGGTCVGQITIKQGTPDTIVKQIAATVGSTK
jgi:hypothetical protein